MKWDPQRKAMQARMYPPEEKGERNRVARVHACVLAC
jgi:hypothetical protein